MLNKIDLRLISALQENGRASYAQLAKSLGISLSTAAKRVESLLKDGVLTIQAVPDPYKIQHTAAALICMNVSVDKLDDVCKRLKSIFSVIMVVTTFGRFNLLIAVYFRSWERLHDFIYSELSGKSDIYETEIFFVKDIRKPFHENLHSSYTEEVLEKIDEVDQKIIEHLTENGRYSGVYIANKLNISASSVSKKLARLFREDIVQVKAQVNPTKLGFHSNAFIFLRADPGKVNDICTSLQPCEEVITIMTLINGYDIYVSLVDRDAESLYKFIKKKMAPSSGIVSLETLIGGEIIKRYYGAFHIDGI